MLYTYLDDSFKGMKKLYERCAADCGIRKDIENISLTYPQNLDDKTEQLVLLLFELYFKGISYEEIMLNMDVIIESFHNGTSGRNDNGSMVDISDEEIVNLVLTLKSI